MEKGNAVCDFFCRKSPGMLWVSDHGLCIFHLELNIIRSNKHKPQEQISKQLYSGNGIVRIELDQIQKAWVKLHDFVAHILIILIHITLISLFQLTFMAFLHLSYFQDRLAQ